MTSTVENKFSISSLLDDSVAANLRKCVQTKKHSSNVQPASESGAQDISMNSRKTETLEPEEQVPNQEEQVPNQEEQKKSFFKTKNALIAGATVLGIAGTVAAGKALLKKKDNSDGKGESASKAESNQNPGDNAHKIRFGSMSDAELASALYRGKVNLR
ncbi:MAG: hypothetical protein LBF94_00025 [Puniceicoccales bacterium]|jgi:hypothetical protein|nr:hypothetical protein [Puniceicoccales bacterium]